MVWSIRACAVTLTAVAVVAVAAPQGARAQAPGFPGGGGTIHIMVPQFVAEAVKFKAIDESGYDRFGSDEVRAVFSDLNPTLLDLVTSKFDGVNTGDTQSFGPNERCIAPRPTCDHGVSEILHFKVSFWEVDPPWPFVQFCYGDAPGLHYWLRHGVCSWDDLIGRAEVLKSREELLAELPRVGDSVEHKLTLGGPCGPSENDVTGCGPPGPSGPEYQLIFRIRRLNDVERSIDIAPPR
jgi:hypothetical protein